MRNILLGAAALGALGILSLTGPADAAAPRHAGIRSEQAIDLSAVHRPRHLRHGSRWVAPRYRYVRPRPYPYYAGPGPYWGGPYYRPYYYRPAPFPFFPFFW